MTDLYSQNRCVCSTRSHGPLLCAFCLSFHFKMSMGQRYGHFTDYRKSFNFPGFFPTNYYVMSTVSP